MAERESPTEEEFDLWLSPAAIYGLMRDHLGAETWRPLLLKRIQDEEAFAAARKAIYRQHGRDKGQYAREHLPREFWQRAGPTYPHHNFWETGDITLTVRGDSYPNNETHISCVDVRFEPDGIQRLIPHASRWKLVRVDAPIAPDIAPAPKFAKGSPVTESEARAWFDALPPRTQALSVRKLWPLAQAAHPGRPLPRKRIEPFCEGRGTGPRTIAPS